MRTQQRVQDSSVSRGSPVPPAVPQLALIGTSYKSSGIQFREALARNATEDHVEDALAADESALLSTCNRFELYFVSSEPKKSYVSLLRHLQDATGIAGGDSELYRLEGEKAVEHLFRVASGLESVVVGEPQILSQVRGAGVSSRKKGNSKGMLSPLFDRAYRVGSRVREAYGFAPGEASLSDLALDAVDRAGAEKKSVMLIGTGKMIRLAARRLKGKAKRLYVVSRRKVPPAGLEWCTLVKYPDLKKVAKRCDVIISATTARRPVLSASDLSGRKARVVVDLGMPRNVSDSVKELPNVKLFNLDDLAKMASPWKVNPHLKVADGAVAKEAHEFYQWLVQTRMSATLANLYSWAEAVREEELKRAVSRLGNLSWRDKHVVDAMGRRIVSKILARPTRFARNTHASLTEEEKLDLLGSVFGAGGTDAE
ncbi:MAG: glutamyl-tRNA reductase [Nitrososphaerota archaeon]|nr:glutamyl-tRNA reductase [Nitrososphaerota archaeon]